MLSKKEQETQELENLTKELESLCNQHKTSIDGINFLINYYTSSLHWSKADAMKYTIKLFNDGTIDEIQVLGGNDGKKN